MLLQLGQTYSVCTDAIDGVSVLKNLFKFQIILIVVVYIKINKT